jgi:hypothetical protein
MTPYQIAEAERRERESQLAETRRKNSILNTGASLRDPNAVRRLLDLIKKRSPPRDHESDFRDLYKIRIFVVVVIIVMALLAGEGADLFELFRLVGQ